MARDSNRYRVFAVLLTCAVSALAVLLLASTSWDPVADVEGLSYPGQPTDLTDYEQYSGNKTEALSAFYTPPTRTGRLAPGSILKTQRIDGAPVGVVAYRVMYTSTRIDGSPVAVTAAFFDRTDPPPPDGRPLVGLAHGTVGMGRKCGVSQAPFTSGMMGELFWGSQIEPLVSAGYSVVATDYQDMGSPGTPSYLVAQSEAYSVLDSVRAALQGFPNRINGNQLLLYGHSQGGQASLGAARYAQTYAPDLAIRGVVSQAPGLIVGLPIVVKQLVRSTEGKSASSRAEFISYLTASWSASFPGGLKPDDILTAEGLEKLPLARDLCGPALSRHYPKPLDAYVKSELPASFVRLLNENVPVGSVGNIPILFTQGLSDTTIVPQFTMAAFRTECELGATADLIEYPNTNHTELLLEGRTDVTDWMNDRLTGRPAPNTCEGRR